MAEVDITINGRSYRISCKDGEEERIKSLATLINNQVQKLSDKIGQLGEARMILLASLVLLDKSDEVEKEAEKIIRPAVNYLIKEKCKKIILGCTELPIAIFAFKSLKKIKESKVFIDPNLLLANVAMKKYKKI